MAVNIMLRNHKLLSKALLDNCSKMELIILTNYRFISNTKQQTQMTTSYGSSKIQAFNKPNLPKNIILRHCSPSPGTLNLVNSMDTLESMPMSATRRPLTLIFAWMLAKDKHLEKYRQMWFRRGFDVLTVRTSPLDLLLPPVGGRVVARNLVRSLSELSDQYNEIVVHAFSVGGYQFGETLAQIIGQEEYKQILHSIKGVVLDSMVYTDDAAPGLSRAITLNPIVQPIIEKSIKVFLKLFNSISVKNYRVAEHNMFNPVIKYPGLVLYSKDDVVSGVKWNEQLAKNWTKLGNSVRSKCWDKSTHVLHYRDHQSDYEQEIDSFIKSLKLRNCRL